MHHHTLPTKTHFNWGHPRHSHRSLNIQRLLWECVCVCVYVKVSSNFWTIRAQNALIVGFSAGQTTKAPLCPLQTLMTLSGTFYPVKWYQKLLSFLLWEPHLTGTWGWGRRYLPWETTQKWDQVTVIVPRFCTKFRSQTDGDSVSLCLLGLWLKASQEGGDGSAKLSHSHEAPTALGAGNKVCWGAAGDSRGKGDPKEQAWPPCNVRQGRWEQGARL